MNRTIVLVFLLPLIGGALTCIPRGRLQRSLALLATLATVAAVVTHATHLLRHGGHHHPLGGWQAPLGINLLADGLSLLMLALTAVVGLWVSAYAAGYFSETDAGTSGEGLFWPLWLLLWGGLNCLFVSGDLFNIYLLLETTLIASVALAALGGSKAGHVSALRYLLAATAAGALYLLGVALLYSETRTLDLRLLHGLSPQGYVPLLALGLMLLGLLLKCALFPLHFWLPAAHSTAPAPVSALLSSLVVKAGFYVILRLWFEVFPATARAPAGHVLATLGAAAILWGAWLALRQKRLKMLIAYSTVSQIGYLFILFPLAGSHGGRLLGSTTYHLLSHGMAKAAMFMGAGALLKSAHSDLLDRTRGSARNSPFAVAAIILAGAALAGILPGGGAKGQLLGLASETGQWWWSAVIVGGVVLAAAYTFAAVRHCFLPATDEPPQATARTLGVLACLLAIAAIGLSFHSAIIPTVLEIPAP